MTQLPHLAEVLRLRFVELGIGARAAFYRIEVVERARRRRRGTRIQGVGDFADLRQLRFVPDEEAR